VSGRRTHPLARAVAAAALLGGVIVLASFLLARRGARSFYSETASLLGPVHTAVNWSWLRARLAGGDKSFWARGPWRAWSCASSSCDFGPAIQLSLTGSVVGTMPFDLAKRLIDERERGHAILYVVLDRGERVREALPPLPPEDEGGPMWLAAFPGGGSSESIVATDRGAVTLLWLPDRWDLAAATERPPRLARFDAWLRERFPGRHIISGDESALLEGLPNVRERLVVTPREGDSFLRWLDRQPHRGWRVIN
jgi:hypothetical protein